MPGFQRVYPIGEGLIRGPARVIIAPFTIAFPSTLEQMINTAATSASYNPAIQSIAMGGSPTGGTFTLSFQSNYTAPIAYTASSAAVAAALQALSNVGSSSNLTATGGALNSAAIVVTFQGLLGNQPIPLMSVTSSLTGGTSPAVTPTTSTAGQTAEHIIGVFDNVEYDFLGNATADDEPVVIYNQFTAFDTSKLANWYAYGALAIAALPTCTFN